MTTWAQFDEAGFITQLIKSCIYRSDFMYWKDSLGGVLLSNIVTHSNNRNLPYMNYLEKKDSGVQANFSTGQIFMGPSGKILKTI